MNSSFLREKLSAILMIILGIIALLFPMFSTETVGFISGIVFILLAAAFIVAGISELVITKYFGLLYILYGIICVLFAYYLIFDPAFVSGVLGFLTYVFGILLIVLGIIAFIVGPLGIIGLTTLLYGFLTVVVAYLVNDPKILGTMIGIWLLISGILSLFTDNKGYIDV